MSGLSAINKTSNVVQSLTSEHSRLGSGWLPSNRSRILGSEESLRWLINLTYLGLNLTSSKLDLTKIILFTSIWTEHLKTQKIHKISLLWVFHIL